MQPLPSMLAQAALDAASCALPGKNLYAGGGPSFPTSAIRAFIAATLDAYCGSAARFMLSFTARAGNRRFGRLSALRAHTKAP
jgi:hypothetical protein